MKVIQNWFIMNDRPRHILGVFLSIYIHVLVIGIFLGLSVLAKPEILEIREISFIDLTVEAETEVMTEVIKKPVIKKKNLFQRQFSKKSDDSQILKDRVEKPINDKSVTPGRRLDMKRKQAPINLAQNDPVMLSKSKTSDILKISPAKGTQTNKKIVPAPTPINLDQKNNLKLSGTTLKLSGTTRMHNLPTAKTPKPQISLAKKKLNIEPEKSEKQPQLFQQPSKNLQLTPAGLKKSRTFITGQLASRKILHKSTPKFPFWAKKQGVGATISMNFTVMEDGRVKENILVVRTSGSKAWDDAVKQALKEWRFAPLSTNGRRDQTGVITFQFVID